MKILIMYDYPPSPGGIGTQGALLARGLTEAGVDVHEVNFESPQEKEWYYRWFDPALAVGIGSWGNTPQLVLHPLRSGVRPLPWFLSDGSVATHHEVLNNLDLILTTSNWVRDSYIRDGVRAEILDVLPVGCDTDSFAPLERSDPKVHAIRETYGVAEDEIMILTVGGDAAARGAPEVMQALALIDNAAPRWKYVCKVWPTVRSQQQNAQDLQLAANLGIDKNVVYSTSIVSQTYLPYLLAACDIYAAPSRLEDAGIIQVQANACGKPVIAVDAPALRDTMVHGETALLAGIDRSDRGRASVFEIAAHLRMLMDDVGLRRRMGIDGRARIADRFDYRTVADRFITLVHDRLGLK